MNNDELLISVKEAARRLSCSTSQLYELLNKQEVESVYMGRLRKVKVSSLREYVERLSPERDAS